MLVGRRLNDRYKVLKVIGGGGMANVYLARDMILDRDVAIKVLRLDFANDESFIKRFHREAQSATSIAHPNIVSIYDVGEQEEIYYIVMEYVPGQTLKQYIQQHAPIPVEKAVDIMTQITSAIAHAHQFGIIHRDLKPQNILIDDNGTVKVTDFGIAVALSSTTITQTNSVLGSVHYLSPEQARGGLANKKSDIYSLGIVLFELLTGRVPFSGESAVSIALKHLQTETPSPKRWNPSIPQSLENVVLKATAKDSFYRYDSVEEMQDALEMSMNPERLNERKFEVPDDEEATKAIPVITDDYIDSPTDETIVRSFSKPVVVPDEEPVQKAPKKKKRKKNKWMVSLLILFLVLAGAGVIAVTVLPSLLLPKDVTIPNLRDEDYEEAVTKLVSLGFVVDDPVLKADEEIAEGKVIRTVPGSGEVVKEGTEVQIYQSTGKEKIAFEDYKGKDVSTVKKMLEQKGYRFIRIVDMDSEEPAGTILDQNPGEETENVPEETDVTFWVSKGPPSVQLKDLSGWTEKSVRDYVSDYDIVVKVKEEHSGTVTQGFVIRQDPAPETTIQKGSELTITLSLGPEPKPPPNNNVNVEVTIQYEPTEPGMAQQVQIYVDDLERDYQVPIEDFTLTETIIRPIQLVIPYNGTAKYKIMRDNQVIEETEVPYSQQ